MARSGRNVWIAAAIGALTAGAAALAAQPKAADSAYFQSKVLLLLQKRCFACHSHAGKIQGGLALDSRSGWEKGGDHGSALVPGDVEKSLLIKAVRFKEPKLQMPPSGKLPADEIAVLEQWIRRGAPDPRVSTTTAAKKGVDLEKGRRFWAFRPVSNPALPAVREKSWPLDAVDRFILAKLEKSGLRPVGDADRYTWLRRVSFDLTGLPPTPAEIDAFVNDRSAMAYSTVVDRLLASRAYGERWARHWMDLTGYADQIGTSNNVFAEHAWRYRDYLIDSFNADKPFDRFVREQIAGDLLPYSTPEERAANLIATGFLVLGDVEIVNPDKLRMETDLIDQQVSKISQAFMAQTVGCARCHDHKFDPIPQADYYALAGIFRSTNSSNRIPYGIWSGIHINDLPETPQQVEERQQREAEHRQKVQAWQTEQAQLQKEQAEIGEKLKAPGADQAALGKRRDEIGARLRKIAVDLEHAEFFKPTVPKAFGVADAAATGDMKITIRGNPYATGDLVPRGVVRVAAWDRGPSIPAGQSGRLQLADWLADKRNPLTARVAVNRIWQKLFGEGIVRSVDYFALRGDKPTHPELLDHLASRFMREGWSQKRLIRALVLSRTYRLASESPKSQVPGPRVRGREGLNERSRSPGSLQSAIPNPQSIDPDNRLIWRANRQRLDAEAIRDGMLAASGELQPGVGGPGMPLEYVENTGGLQPQGVNPPSFQLVRFRPEQEFQRTIYLPIIRASQPSPTRLLDVFDFTQPAQWAGKRSQTVVPTQALFLLNNEMVRKRATGLAASLAQSTPERAARLDALWLRVLNRPITAEESADANAFLDKLEAQDRGQAANPALAWVELCHALLASNEFLFRL